MPRSAQRPATKPMAPGVYLPPRESGPVSCALLPRSVNSRLTKGTIAYHFRLVAAPARRDTERGEGVIQYLEGP